MVLDSIRSTENVGSIFRTADAAGVSCIYLSGITPAPVDRFGRIRKAFHKSALGAEHSVPWKSVPSIARAITELRKQGFFIVAVEQHPTSCDYRRMPNKKKIAFVFGNEVTGVSSTALAQADMISEIPMRGKKESLNVAVTAGVILFLFQ